MIQNITSRIRNKFSHNNKSYIMNNNNVITSHGTLNIYIDECEYINYVHILMVGKEREYLKRYTVKLNEQIILFEMLLHAITDTEAPTKH